MPKNRVWWAIPLDHIFPVFPGVVFACLIVTHRGHCVHIFYNALLMLRRVNPVAQ